MSGAVAWWVAVALVLFRPMGALAQGGPQPPCGVAPQPSYAAAGASPTMMSWHTQGWTPPSCAGWTSPRSTLLVALAGSFRHAGGAEALLTAFGRVSGLRGIRYWSVSDAGWRTLITDAVALDGPETRWHRADFTPAEMARGGDLYFAQQDSRSSGEVVYRMRVLEIRPDRVVVTVENATAVRLFLVPLFARGDLQSTFYLERLAPGVWGYYGLWGIHTGTLTAGHDTSSVNRALALYRHIAGIPTDQEPPAARH